jgi:hypothetical protein
MKYGIREICDVVLKAKSKMVVGNKVFYKDEPVIYFDSLKTSTMEGAATTVYAQGGRGNSRLVAWEGERTVTFTMEDALISTVGLAILTGADVIAAEKEAVIQHISETKKVKTGGKIELTYGVHVADKGDYIYVMVLDDNGNVASEPYLYTGTEGSREITMKTTGYNADTLAENTIVLVDYYTMRDSGATQIDITPDKFGGNFYLEASTLFRDTNGVDMPAEFIIPNCKVQSNFTFTMASSGDPSTFTFTMDAFPDYTRWNKEKKVLSAIQIITEDENDEFAKYGKVRTATDADRGVTSGVTKVTILAPDAVAKGEQVYLRAITEPAGLEVKWSIPDTGDSELNGNILTVEEECVVTATVGGVNDTHTITVK